MAIYGIVTYLRLRRRLITASPLRNNIYLADDRGLQRTSSHNSQQHERTRFLQSYRPKSCVLKDLA